jgi:hypothetical protein
MCQPPKPALKEKQAALETLLTQKGLQAKADHWPPASATQKEWQSAAGERQRWKSTRCQTQWSELSGQIRSTSPLAADDWQDGDKLKTRRATAEQLLAALALRPESCRRGRTGTQQGP